MPENDLATTHHDPSRFFDAASNPDEAGSRVLIVLHQHIHARTAFARAFDACRWRVLADGGADRMLDLERSETGSGSGSESGDVVGEVPVRFTTLTTGTQLPDMIVGDLDSITPFAKSHYHAQRVPIAHDPDQYSTDFGKAIKAARALSHIPSRAALRDLLPSPLPPTAEWADLHPRLATAAKGSAAGPATDVLVFSTLGGRVDQGLGLVSELAHEQALAESQSAAPPWTYWLVSESSLSFVLAGPGRHALRLGGGGGVGAFGVTVGILPVLGPATISTRGLRWDVEAWRTEMGGDVSTSNRVVAEDGVVVVETSARVLFTIELSAELAN